MKDLLLDLMNTGFAIPDLYTLILCCVFVGQTYYFLEGYFETEKAKAWLIMLQSSFVLSIVGTLQTVASCYYDLWTLEEIYTENRISRLVVIYFIASNIMDLLIGSLYYRKYLDPFSTIAHHIFYIIFMICLLQHHISKGFLLCFFMEIPTFVLALGTAFKSLRSDIMFGITFLFTRLLYNAYMVYKLEELSPEGTIWKICCAVLCLHIFWFSKWCQVYGVKILSSPSMISLNEEE